MNAKVVLDGLILGESPRWHDGRLWVADWAAHELITLDAAGVREVAECPDSVPCCIDWLPDGRLLLVSGGRLLRREPDGSLFIVTAPWPNDFRTPAGQVLAVQVTVPSARAAAARG